MKKIFSRTLPYYLFILIVPGLFFPVMLALSILFDWLFGDSFLLMEIIVSQKQYLLSELFSDWMDSLLLSVFVSWVAFNGIYFLLRNKPYNMNIFLPFTGFMISFIFSLVVFNLNIMPAFLYGLTGLILASMFTLLRNNYVK